jgi:hypothetical protein
MWVPTDRPVATRAKRGLLPLSGSEAEETGSCPRFAVRIAFNGRAV